MPLCMYDSNFKQKEILDKEISSLLKEVNKHYSNSYKLEQIVISKTLFKKEKIVYEVLYQLDGSCEYQVINFYRENARSINVYASAEIVVAYFYGLLGGSSYNK